MNMTIKDFKNVVANPDNTKVTVLYYNYKYYNVTITLNQLNEESEIIQITPGNPIAIDVISPDYEF